MDIRKPDFAGSWYPGRRSECLKVIEDFSKSPIPCPAPAGENVAGIVPHAGWYYSGPIAFGVIHCMKNGEVPDVVVIFGRHLRPGSGNYIMREGAWGTPLGELEIEQDLAGAITSEFQFIVETVFDYEPDNTIELQLPFIKYLFPDTKIVPIGVPPDPESIRIGERVGEISKSMGLKTLILGSTDLTHYGLNYGHAPKGIGKEAVEWVKNENDKRMVDLMLAMDPQGVISESLRNSNACCSGAVAAAIAAARSTGARKGEKLIYRTSYDVRPDNSFVGYAGVLYQR
jgi:AmmeMemoRadiSam system protein B